MVVFLMGVFFGCLIGWVGLGSGFLLGGFVIGLCIGELRCRRWNLGTYDGVSSGGSPRRWGRLGLHSWVLP